MCEHDRKLNHKGAPGLRLSYSWTQLSGEGGLMDASLGSKRHSLVKFTFLLQAVSCLKCLYYSKRTARVVARSTSGSIEQVEKTLRTCTMTNGGGSPQCWVAAGGTIQLELLLARVQVTQYLGHDPHHKALRES